MKKRFRSVMRWCALSASAGVVLQATSCADNAALSEWFASVLTNYVQSFVFGALNLV